MKAKQQNKNNKTTPGFQVKKPSAIFILPLFPPFFVYRQGAQFQSNCLGPTTFGHLVDEKLLQTKTQSRHFDRHSYTQ